MSCFVPFLLEVFAVLVDAGRASSWSPEPRRGRGAITCRRGRCRCSRRLRRWAPPPHRNPAGGQTVQAPAIAFRFDPGGRRDRRRILRLSADTATKMAQTTPSSTRPPPPDQRVIRSKRSCMAPNRSPELAWQGRPISVSPVLPTAGSVRRRSSAIPSRGLLSARVEPSVNVSAG